MPQIDISTVPQTTQDFLDVRHLFTQLARQRQPKLVLETGTDVGDTTRLWSALLQETGGHLWTIDTKPPVGNWLATWPLKNVTFLQGDALHLQWAQKMDVLFLDDNHQYDHLAKELIKFGPWVRPGGLILCHGTLLPDYGEGIRKALHEWTSLLRLPWTHYPLQGGVGVIEVTYELPPAPPALKNTP